LVLEVNAKHFLLGLDNRNTVSKDGNTPCFKLPTPLSKIPQNKYFHEIKNNIKDKVKINFTLCTEVYCTIIGYTGNTPLRWFAIRNPYLFVITYRLCAPPMGEFSIKIQVRITSSLF